jgi:hypothetical protein
MYYYRRNSGNVDYADLDPAVSGIQGMALQT